MTLVPNDTLNDQTEEEDKAWSLTGVVVEVKLGESILFGLLGGLFGIVFAACGKIFRASLGPRACSCRGRIWILLSCSAAGYIGCQFGQRARDKHKLGGPYTLHISQ